METNLTSINDADAVDKRRGKFQVAIVGCGEHATQTLLPALRVLELGLVDIVALCDIDQTAIQKFLPRVPGAKPFPNMEALLDSCHVDCAILCSTPQAHEATMFCLLDRGIPFFVEKPVALHAATLKSLAEIAREKNVYTQAGHNFRYATAFRKLKDRIEAEPPSLPAMCSINYRARWPREDRWNSGSVARAFMLTHGIHMIDICLHLFGEFADVSLASGQPGRNGGLAFGVNIEHRDGVLTRLQLSNGAPRFAFDLCFQGHDGSEFRIDNFSSFRETRPGSARDTLLHWQPGGLDNTLEIAGYAEELRMFFESLASGAPKIDLSLAGVLPSYEAIDRILEILDHKCRGNMC